MNKKGKFDREKCRQEIARQYNEKIRTLNEKIRVLQEEKIVSTKLIEHQQKKIAEQEEKINLYKMVVDIPQSEIVKLIDGANTKFEFLEAIHNINKMLK